ncbi:MAG: hypothetical protein HDR03_03050, partial [Lachnospiraceae bacterium]|nr:hypothetical protein [Lachnospiraceae bacterium]
MSKLAKKLSRQIMAFALSVAMIMPNMAVYASEVSDPDSILPASKVVEANDTVDGTDAEENIVAGAQLSDTEDETIKEGEDGTSGKADENDDSELEAEKPSMDQSARAGAHTITVNTEVEDGEAGENGGTAVADEGSADAGETITLTATPKDGYMLKEWKVDTGSTAIPQFGIKSSEADATRTDADMFTMPEGDVSITAVFKKFGEDAITWDLAKITTDSDLTIQGKTGYIDGLRVDATKGKVGPNGSWPQANLGTIIKVPVQGASKVTVTGYNQGSYKVDGETATVADQQPQTFLCTGENGWAEIEMLSNSYLSTIKMEPVVVDNTFKPVAEAADNLDIAFKPIAQTKTDGAAIDTSATTANEDLKSIAVKNIVWHNPSNGSHGIVTNDADNAMAITIPTGKKADITILGCQWGSKAVPTAIGADGSALKVAETTAPENYGNGDPVAPEYTVLGAEGTVTVSFVNNMYIHNLKVNYWAAGVTDKYTIKVNAGEHGSASADKAYAAETDEVTLTVTPDEGYESSIKLTDKDCVELDVTVDGDNKFEMPGEDVIVEVTFTAAGEPHGITVITSVEHGSAEAGTQRTAVAKTLVDMDDVAIATPATGYELKEWKVTYTDEEGNTAEVEVTKTGKKYSFTMPDADITITPVFQEAVAKYFQTTYFNKQFTDGNHGSNSDKSVDDVDGLEVLNGRFLYNDAQHGINVNGAEIKLTLDPSKKYDIVVWECSEGNKTGTITASSAGTAVEVVTETKNNDEDPVKTESGVKKFTMLNVENEVTLIFSANQEYVHSIILTESSGVAKYTVTVSGGENGTAQTDKAIAEANDDITLTAKPNPGFKFKEWKVVSPEENGPEITPDPDNENVATFKMPASDVTIQAVFESTGENPADIQDKDGFYNGLLADEPIDGRKYYFDFSEQLTEDATLPDTYTEGIFSYSKGTGPNNAKYHGTTYGIEFKAYNTLTFQVSGDCTIVVGGDSNSNCTKLKATSESGTLKPDELSTITSGHGTLANCKTQTGDVLAYEYTGEEGSVTFTLDEAGSKAYIVAVCIIPKKKADPSAPTYTYTFNPTNENIAGDNYVTPAGSKFVNDYFEIVDGDITGKNGKVELQNDAKSAVKFATKETSTVSILAESTSGSNTSNLVLYKYNSTDQKWDIVDDIKEVVGNTAVTITYENLEAGTYKVAVPSETHPYGRGVRISKIEVTEKLTPETVTVNVDAPDDGTALTLVYTCRETQEVIRKPIENAKSVATLNALYTYDLMIEPTRYVITEGAELKLGAANETLTAEHDIKVEAVLLRTLSGSIKGLDEDSEALSKLNISFAKPSDMLYIPNITIDRDNKTYTAELESGVEYTIITEGINDYELDYNVSNNSDKIRITSDTAGRNITYVKKPVYKVTIAPKGATLDDLANATFTFTNLNEEGYVYDFTGTDNIELRDGTYSVKVSNSGIYVQQLTSNLIVDGKPVTKEISFNSDITEWDFSDPEWTAEAAASGAYRGLELTSVSKNKTYALMGNGSIIKIPANKACNIIVTFCYQAAADINGKTISTNSNNTGTHETVTYEYNGTGDVKITATGTTYIEKISMLEPIEYKAELMVGTDDGCDYTTINDALNAVRKMSRTADQSVTISIKPGDYEEMIVVDVANVTLKNASDTPSIGLRNKGVDIDPNAVRITSYYGVGYDYYSMDSNYKWNEEILENNKANGYATCSNPTGGGTASYWNATAVITASNVSVEGIIFENSFNQYISKKAAEDVLVKQGGAKEGTVPRASMAVGDTTVQNKEYVERAAALAIADGCNKVSFDNCKVIGRQDTLYGGTGAKVAFYNCAIYGSTDYIMGPMTAVFAKCDLVFNTNDQTEKGLKDDIGYITAAQQKSGRGYLMYNCHVTSTVPGVDTASEHTSKPGYFGRPWAANTGEAVFYKTIIDEVDAYWQSSDNSYIKDELKGKSLIAPAGWNSSLQGESVLSKEFGTYEVAADVNNKSNRVTWATTPDTNPYDSDEAAVTEFLSDWKDWEVFKGKDMTIVLPSDENIAVPAAPTAIVTPEPTTTGDDENPVTTVIKGATIVLSAEAGAKVYYFVNPAEDAELNAESGTPYAGAIKVEDSNIKDDSITIKAIAVKYSKTSDIASFTYTVTEAPDTKAPVLPEEGDIKLGSRIKISADAGAEIYYNVNSDKAPDKTAILYTGKDGIEITTELVKEADSTVTIKAVAILNGKTSTVASATYGVIVNAPTANPKSGYQFPDGGGKVELTADEDVTILYTMGSEPKDPTADDAEPETYNKATGIPVSADTTIKAVAKRGTRYSEVVTLKYTVPLSMPTADHESGSELLPNDRTVRLTAGEDATIYYTTGTDAAFVADPSKADSGRETYSDGITVDADTTVIKAVAAKGDQYSVVAVFTYTLSDTVAALTAKVNNSPVRNGATMAVDKDSDVTVKFETATKDAVIYYTLDETEPNAESEPYNNATGIVISNISERKVVKAIATKTNMSSSQIFTVTLNVTSGGSHGGDESGLVIDFVDEGAGTYEYTGSAIKPEIEVRNNGNPLVPGTDYTVKYSNNINVSTTAKKPTITVSGKGILTGKAVKEFNITPKAIDDEDVIAGKILVAVGKKVSAPSVYYGNTKLKAG